MIRRKIITFLEGKKKKKKQANIYYRAYFY